MPQLLLQGFPMGAIRIGSSLSILDKEGMRTYFIGSDNYFSHPTGDASSQRFVIASLIANSHVRACEITRSPLGIPHRTLMNWTRQLTEQGASSFFVPRSVRGSTVLTPQKIVECEELFRFGTSVAATARKAGVKESTLRKAISDGRIGGPNRSGHRSSSMHDLGTTKSERSRLDAQAAEGLGTACTRANERVEAAMGVVQNACGRFETCRDVRFGGVLAGLPALCGNGLFSGLGKHLSLPAGFYSAMHILTLLGFMALARIRRPEGLRHIPPGKLGKVIGLDRAPEVRTLREKISIMGKTGTVREWMKELSAVWMDADPTEAGYLYVDGHVRVYHGDRAVLPTRFVSREKLCLRGTTDYWVNDALGRPFFVVSKTVTEGLSSVLLNEIVSDLLETVPQQPSQAELDADPLLHRFIIVFDREGSSHDLLSKL
jgi:transposase-like protein